MQTAIEQKPVSENPEILFTEALIRAQLEMGHALKDAVNSHFKNKYADLASVIDAVKYPLGINGFCYIQYPEQVGDQLFLRTDLKHIAGHKISSFTPLMILKNDMQGLGSAITYARRYALSAMVGLTQDDDDGNASSRRDRDSHVKSFDQSVPPSPIIQVTAQISEQEIKRREEHAQKIEEGSKIKVLREELDISQVEIEGFMAKMNIDPKKITLQQLKGMVKFLEEEKLARASMGNTTAVVDPSFN